MKVNKNKNSTFISNYQLIEGLKNRSARSLNRNRNSETSISLIKRKNFDQNIEPNIQIQNSNNQSPMSNTLNKQRSIATSISKYGENSNKKVSQSNNLEPTKHEAALLAKIEQLYMEKNKLKKQKKIWEQKYRQQVARNQIKEQNLRKQNEKLHKLIIKQSQMITNQDSSVNKQREENTEQLRRILHTQAVALQSMGCRRKKFL